MQIIKSIQSRIHEIRGERVMLDYSLASLYEVETKVLNQAVKRNIMRFPEDFMCQLSSYEWLDISSQNDKIDSSTTEDINQSQIVTGSQKSKNTTSN